jgi:hypothetical protein
VEETGSHSVIPSTIPNKTAFKNSINAGHSFEKYYVTLIITASGGICKQNLAVHKFGEKL